MRNFKQSLSIITIVGASLFAMPMSFADPAVSNNTDSSNSEASSQISQNFADSSVEDMVAVAKAGRQNEAINDAVLGNEAITDNLPQLDQSDSGVNNQAEASARPSSQSVQPRQSTAQSVDSDKLILNSPVVDQANILNAQEKQILTQRLRHIYDQGLAQVALVTVPTTNGMDIFQYSLEVAEKWGLGEADTDDGLLILVAVNDRDMFILQGYGLEGVLPDATLNRIIEEEITPSFKQNDYAGGLIKGINRVEERLTTDPDVLAQSDAIAEKRRHSSSADAEAPSLFGTFIIALIFGLFLTSLLGRILGSLVSTGGFVLLSLSSGGSLIMTLFMAVFLWMFLISRGSGGGKGGGKGGGRRRRSGVIFFPGGGFGGGGSGGGFGGGGFGGGGFGGGGGGFGGGGAGGSW